MSWVFKTYTGGRKRYNPLIEDEARRMARIILKINKALNPKDDFGKRIQIEHLLLSMAQLEAHLGYLLGAVIRKRPRKEKP